MTFLVDSSSRVVSVLIALLWTLTGCLAVSSAVLDTCPPAPPEAAQWQKLNDEAEQAYSDSNFGVAELLLVKALDEAKKQHFESERARTLNSLGVLKQEQKRYSEAEKFLTEALSIREKLLGENHQCVIATLIDLGGLYEDEGKAKAAESMLLRALKFSESEGEDSLQLAVVLNNLGSLCYSLHKKEDARRYLKRALSSYRKLRPDDPQIRAIMQILLNLYQSAHQYDEFRSLYVEFARGNPNANPRSLLKAAHVTAQQADELATAGLLGDAETMYNRSLALFEASAQSDSEDCKSVKAAYLKFQRRSKETSDFQDRTKTSQPD
jgi:tetratricopeptide (TPR) repeat protein